MLTCRLVMARASTPSASPASAEADALFAALASAERRRMLDLVVAQPGLHIAALGSHFAMSDVAVLKHVKVLEAAGLLITERSGRQRRLYFNVMPIQAIYERWTDAYSSFWAGEIADIKSRVEARAQARRGQGVRRA